MVDRSVACPPRVLGWDDLLHFVLLRVNSACINTTFWQFQHARIQTLITLLGVQLFGLDGYLVATLYLFGLDDHHIVWIEIARQSFVPECIDRWSCRRAASRGHRVLYWTNNFNTIIISVLMLIDGVYPHSTLQLIYVYLTTPYLRPFYGWHSNITFSLVRRRA